MKRKKNVTKMITLGIFILFFSTNIIMTTGTVGVEQAPQLNFDGNTLYVGGDGPGNYSSIQDAIDAASHGDTVFVYSGTYYENVIVDKILNIFGENKESTIIDGGGIGNVVNISSDSVVLEGFTIQNAGSTYLIDWVGGSFGIYAFADSGIYVLSDNNHIRGNIIKDNPYHGIHLHSYADYNVISNNIITNTPGYIDNGIVLQFSSYNVISNNSIINNSLHGIHLLQNCNNNIIRENDIIKNNCGLEISGNIPSANNIITQNNILHNRNLGIYLFIQCYNTEISDNNIVDNNMVGIVLYQMCDGSQILNNIISGQDTGISVELFVDSISISNNIITNHDVSGIELMDFVDKSTINGNTIQNNCNGIRIEGSDENVFYENIISNNQRGIYSKYILSDNLFYHNDFIENTENACVNLGNNLWDNGYPFGGNYWDDHPNPLDIFSGLGQNISGCDGIIDTPYAISSGNEQDIYPFITPDGWLIPDGWPMFHHDAYKTGNSTSTAPNTNNTKWIYNLDGIFLESSPAVVDGRVYIGAKTWWREYTMFCFDAENGGEPIWTHIISGDFVSSSYCSPAVVDGKVYIGSTNGKMYCLDAEGNPDLGTTTELWNYSTGGSIYSSPTVVDGYVYFGSHDKNVYCLDADPFDDDDDAGIPDDPGSNYDLIWSYTTGERVTSSPAVFNDRVYIGSIDGKMYCLDATNGDYIWDFQTGGPISYSSTGIDERLYFGSWDHNVYCINAIDKSLIWSFTTGDKVLSSPAVADGRVYVGSYDNNIYCLDAEGNEDGSTNKYWEYETDDWVFSSPAVADGKVFVGSRDGTFYCLDASDTVGLIWEYETTGEYPFDGIGSSPAIANGNVYIASTNGSLYAFGDPDPIGESPGDTIPPVIKFKTNERKLVVNLGEGIGGLGDNRLDVYVKDDVTCKQDVQVMLFVKGIKEKEWSVKKPMKYTEELFRGFITAKEIEQYYKDNHLVLQYRITAIDKAGNIVECPSSEKVKDSFTAMKDKDSFTIIIEEK